MSPAEKPEARDAVVPPSYSTPSVPSEALDLYEAFRGDVRSLRGDLVDGFEAARQATHAQNERLAGQVLAVYRLVEAKLEGHASEARAHRAEFVTFAASQRALETDVRAFMVEIRETQGATRDAVKSLVNGERIVSPKLEEAAIAALPLLSFEALALRLRVPRATLRLVVIAVVVTAMLVSTLTACIAHAGK